MKIFMMCLAQRLQTFLLAVSSFHLGIVASLALRAVLVQVWIVECKVISVNVIKLNL